ncbi:MAG: hypothetical protein RL065_2301 [Bacteroidota bacterium]|jgi:hypothetical protein
MNNSASKSSLIFTSFLWKLYFFLLPFENLLEYSFGIKSQLKPYRVVSLIIILFYFSKFFLKGKGKINLHGHDFLILIIFLLGVIISVFNYILAPQQFDWDLFFLNGNQILIGILVYIFFRNYSAVLNSTKIESIISVYSVGICINNVFLILQSIFSLELINGLRPSGFIANPNSAGLQNSIVILFFLYKFYNIKGNRKQALYSLLIFFLIVGIFDTQSRVSLFIILIVLASYFFQLSPIKKIIIGGVSLLFVLLFGSLLMQTEMISRIERKSKSNRPDERVEIWDKAMRLGVDTKFAGIGIGQFQRKSIVMEYFSITSFPSIRGELRKGTIGFGLHNTFLHVLIVYGFIPFLLFLTYIFILNRNLFLKCKKDKFSKNSFNMFLWLSFLSVLFYSFTGEVFLSPLFWVFFAIFASNFNFNQNVTQSLTGSDSNHEF